MNDLMERYIYAVVRKLPAKIREDVSKELKTLIEDMLEERCGDIAPNEHDLKVVIAELGTPSELAQKYRPDGAKSALISEPYYSRYLFVLKIAAIVILAALTIGYGIKAWRDNEAYKTFPWFAMYFWNWFTACISTGISVVGIVTVIFSVLEYKNVSFEGDVVSDLPAVPKKYKESSKASAIIGIGVSVFFTAALLLYPEMFGFISADGSRLLPIFDAEYIRSMTPLICAFGILGIANSVFMLLERKNINFILGEAAIDMASIPLTIFLFGNGAIMNNYGIRMYLKKAIGYNIEADVMAQLMCNLNYIICGVLIFCFVISCITTVVRYINIIKEK